MLFSRAFADRLTLMGDEMAGDSGQAGRGTGDPIDVHDVQHHIEILQRIGTSPDADPAVQAIQRWHGGSRCRAG